MSPTVSSTPFPKKTVTFADPPMVEYDPPVEYVEVPPTGLDKLLVTAAIIVPLAVWIWGIHKFHQCGSGWVVAALKQLGVHLGVLIGYGAIVAAIVGLLKLWTDERASDRAGEFLKPWGPKGVIIMHAVVAAATFIIFKDGCKY